MADIAVKYPSASGGVHFKRPSELFAQNVPAGNLLIYQGTTQRTSDGAAGFFTECGNRGVNVNTDFTADTYKTLLNVTSGAGLLAGLIGPTAPAGSQTTTWEVTVDGGTADEIAMSPASGERAILGANSLSLNAFAGVDFLTPFQSLSAGKNQFTGSTAASPAILPWNFIRLFGTPCLQFKTSLLVRVKHSANVTNTAADGRQCAALYMLEI